jgi:hypothetical protein
MTDSTAQSALSQSLFRIEPTQGFVDYVTATKPYHTKILDVLVEYVYAEDLNVTITDRISWIMEFTRPDTEVVYSCGYGFIWDPLPTLGTPDSIVAPVIIEESTADIPAPFYPIIDVQPVYETFTVAGDVTTIFPAGKTFTVQGSTGNNGSWTVASSVFTINGTIITVTGNITNAVIDGTISTQTVFPITGVNTTLETFAVAGNATATFTVGRVFGVQNSTDNDGLYTVVSSVFALGVTTITVVEDITNTTVDGTISIQTTSNSFLIQSPTYVPFTVATVSTGNNQMVMCGENYDIVGVNAALGTWTVNDPDGTLVVELISGTLPKVIYVSSDTGPVGNGGYTVWMTTEGAPADPVRSTQWPLPGTVTFYVVEPIPVQAAGDGVLHRPLESTLSFPIVAVTTGSPGTWTIDEHAANLARLQPGQIFTVVGNVAAANGTYTIVSVTNIPGYQTEIEVLLIDGAATATGFIQVQELPAWPAGQAIEFALVSGVMPAPIAVGTRYFFQPASTAGRFNVSFVRYPNKYEHFVDIATLGTGTFTVQRDEAYTPGALVTVKDSYLHRNDGRYVVRDVFEEGSTNERVYVYQKVNASTPAAVPFDGLMTFDIQGYDEPIYCPPAQMPDFYADTFIHESLKFQFEINLTDAMYATYGENLPRGFGDTAYGDSLLGAFGTYADSFDVRTVQTSGNPNVNAITGHRDSAHTVLPTGIDTQLYDLGGLEETVQSVKLFYGRESP